MVACGEVYPSNRRDSWAPPTPARYRCSRR